MDSEDRDHFKTMQNPSQRRLDVLRQQQHRASLNSNPDQAYCSAVIQPKVDKLRQLLKSWKSDEAKP